MDCTSLSIRNNVLGKWLSRGDFIEETNNPFPGDYSYLGMFCVGGHGGIDTG